LIAVKFIVNPTLVDASFKIIELDIASQAAAISSTGGGKSVSK